MPRRGYIAKRDVLPDPIYNSKVVTKLVNNIMLDGKKSVAQNIVYDAFDIIKEKEGKNPLEVFEAALENVMPVLEVKARRVGGATYQVPLEIRPERRQTLGLRWLVSYARNRHEKTMAEKLAGEIMDAVAGKILIEWQKLIKHLHTISGKIFVKSNHLHIFNINYKPRRTYVRLRLVINLKNAQLITFNKNLSLRV